MKNVQKGMYVHRQRRRSSLPPHFAKTMQPWKTLSRKLIHHQPPWLIVEHHAVQLPEGRIIPDWPWVITPNYVNVIAVTEDLRVPCFRQTKYGLEGPTLGIVGGFIEPGEEALVAAKRELREETGYESPLWESLGEYRVDPNRGIAMGSLFLAQGAVKTSSPVGGDLEEQQPVQLTLLELATALDRGEIKVMAWATAIALALRRLAAGKAASLSPVKDPAG